MLVIMAGFNSTKLFSLSLSDYIHGWSNASYAVSLISADLFKSLVIMSLASSDIVFHNSLFILNDPFRTLLIISLLVLPPNGGLPQSMIYMMTPIDQISH
jgi:hypothetical protein